MYKHTHTHISNTHRALAEAQLVIGRQRGEEGVDAVDKAAAKVVGLRLRHTLTLAERLQGLRQLCLYFFFFFFW